MKKSSNLFVNGSIAYKHYLMIALLTLIHFAPLANAYPGNQQRYDCYRKRNNRYSFGSPTNVSDTRFLCIPNPHYRSRNRPSQQQRRSTRQKTSRRYYQNNYNYGYRGDTGARFAAGLGGFVFGAFVGSALWPWGWGWGWGGWGGDIFIDDSINIIGDIGDLDIGIGDIGDLDASVQGLDLMEIDAGGDEIYTGDFDGLDDDTLGAGGDLSLDEFEDEPDFDPGIEDMDGGDFRADDFDDFRADDFDDFGGGDFGDFDGGGFDDF